jgi:hypothetical protein
VAAAINRRDDSATARLLIGRPSLTVEAHRLFAGLQSVVRPGRQILIGPRARLTQAES